jgi:replicative DNA helicase
MYPSDYILVAARPGMGKTAFLVHLVDEATKDDKDVLIFSIEMPKIQLAERYLAKASKIAYWKIRAGKGFTPNDYKLFEAAKPKIDKFKKHVLINDNSRMDITRLGAIAKKEYIRNPNIKAVFIDYVQLMQTGDDLNVETSKISRGLKQVARELQVPVIALSQLSRKLESRPIEERKPILSDLRDSGSLEQDADAVVFLYTPFVYTKADKDKGVTSLICGKQRNGATFEHDMGFDGSIQTYREMP